MCPKLLKTFTGQKKNSTAPCKLKSSIHICEILSAYYF